MIALCGRSARLTAWLQSRGIVTRAASTRSLPSVSRSLRGFDPEVDLDLVAEGEPARIEDLVPVQAPVLAVERAARKETDPLSHRWLLCAIGVLDIERHRPGDPAHRQIARDFEAVASSLDHRALEDELGVLLHIEEVGRPKVRVAPRLLRVDARGVDLDLEARVLRSLLVEDQRAAPPRELPLDRCKHQLAHREVHA